MRASDELLAYLESYRHDLHVTGITDEKRWPKSASSLDSNSNDSPEELMKRFIVELCKLLRARKAMLVISMVRCQQQAVHSLCHTMQTEAQAC